MRLVPLAALVLILQIPALADWRQFRGNTTTGVADDQNVPTKWGDTENIAWKADLPGHGLSSPIIVGDRVFVTASEGHDQNHLLVLCFEAKTGQSLWRRDFLATGNTMRFPTNPVATCTPCSDGQRIYAQYSTNDVVCLDLEGNLQWLRGLTLDYPLTGNSLGMASSPVVSGETLVVQIESDSQGVACGLDVATGTNRWKLERPQMANWTSPLLLPGATPDNDLVVLQSGKGLSAIRPYTGVEVWNFSGGAATIASSATNGGYVLVPSNGLQSLLPEPGQKSPKVVWKAPQIKPNMASPIAYGDYVYSIDQAGVLEGVSLLTGKEIKKLRLPGKESVTSTPVAANGHLFILRESGLAMVVKAGASPEVVFTHDFGERFQSTPAIADGALYIRSDGHLWKLAK